jgi:small subunit ribosomal protein S6
MNQAIRILQRLSFDKHKEGIYVQLSHNGDGQHVAVLEKAMRLSEDVIRYLTVKQEGPLPEPRVMPGTAPAPVQQEQAQESSETQS